MLMQSQRHDDDNDDDDDDNFTGLVLLTFYKTRFLLLCPVF